MEEHFTDKEFCEKMKIDRATSARWREQGIVGYLKLPNGQIRYKQAHIDALDGRFEVPASAAFEDSDRPIKSGIVSIGIAERRDNGSVAKNA
jgi:hypothetical protein